MVLGTSWQLRWNCLLSGHNKRRLKKPRKKGKKNEKMTPRNPKITEKLVNRALREKSIHYAPKAHDLLQKIFQLQFVQPSADKGLLGNTPTTHSPSIPCSSTMMMMMMYLDPRPQSKALGACGIQ